MKKRILSTFLTLALLLTLLPTAVMAEGGQTIYTQSAYTGVDSDGTKDRPFTSFDAALSEAKRLGGHNTIVILGGTTQNDNSSTSAPLIIDTPVTIEGRTADDNSGQATFNIRSGGIVLGTDVTMKNVALELTNRYHNAIFVNGHKFTAENVVRGHGSREVHLFAGGLKGAAADSGTKAVLTLRNSQFGNIYAGSMNESYTGNAQISITNSTVGTIYGSGGDDSNYNPDSSLGQEEPPAPPAKPNYTVSGPVSITVDGTTTVGGQYSVSVNGNGSSDTSLIIDMADESKKLNLAGLKNLTINGGTATVAEINETAGVTLDQATISFAGSKTINSLSGNGNIVLGKETKLTITGTFDGTYDFEVSGGQNNLSGAAAYDHTYITAGTNNATVNFNPHATQTDMSLEWKEGEGWKTSAMPEVSQTVASFRVTESSKTVSVEEFEEGNCFIPVEWTSSTQVGTLTMIPFRYQVNYLDKSYEKAAKLDLESNVYSATIAFDDNSIMELSGQDGDLSGSSDGIAIAGNLAAGTYQISIFAPTAGNGEIEQAFTLTVTDGSVPPQPPVPAKTLESISITHEATKTTYTVGQPFDPTGMVVTATYSDSTTAKVSGYTTSPTGLLTRNDTTITVSYTEGNETKTTTQPITVKGKTASADMFTLTDSGLTYNTQNQIDAIEKAVALKADYTNKVGVTTVTVAQNGATVAEAINAGEYEVYVSCAAGTEYDALVKTKLGTVTIGKANYGDRAAAGAAKAGTSGTVDLSGKLVDGSITNLSITNGENILDGTPTISGKALTFKIADSAMTGSMAVVRIEVTNANYDPYAIAVTLTVSDKPVPTVTPPTVISGLVYNGQEQALITAGTVPEGCKMLYKVGTGDFTETVPTGKDAGNYVVSYKVVGNGEYADVAQTTLPWVAIAQKKATIRPKDFVINRGDEIPKFRLAHINFVSGEVTSYSTQPTFECKDTNGQDVTKNTAPGTYPIKWTNADSMTIDAKNYDWTKELTGTLTIKDEPVTPPGGGSTGGGSSSGGSGSSGGSSSGGGSSSDRDNSGSTGKVETTTKPDGTKVQTETKKDGTKVETTTAKDGSTSKTTTNPNGSSVTENKAADGSTGTVKTDKHGQTTAETQLSGKAIEDAKKNGEPVKAPVEVEATRNSNTAPVVNIEVPKSAGETKVEIPVTNVKPGTVAVLVHSDGTEEIIKDSIPTENGIQLTVDGSATVKIVDNSKDFIDTREHWSRDQVNFVAARELFQGVGDNQFGVGRPMTRGMVNTVLARLAGVDTTPATGQNWYDKGIAWARENGVSDGTNPNGSVTREQLATMLYRYAGSPTVSGTLPFTDTHEANLYAQDALLWAVQNGILNGYGDGRIGPKANAERAQVAAMMARLIQNAQ